MSFGKVSFGKVSFGKMSGYHFQAVYNILSKTFRPITSGFGIQISENLPNPQSVGKKDFKQNLVFYNPKYSKKPFYFMVITCSRLNGHIEC